MIIKMQLSSPSFFELYLITKIKPIKLDESPILQKEAKEYSPSGSGRAGEAVRRECGYSGSPLEIVFSNGGTLHIFSSEIKDVFVQLAKRGFPGVAVENGIKLKSYFTE